MSDELIEQVARRLWFEYVDYEGYPSEYPTWDEMAESPMSSRDRFRKMARGAIEVMRYRD